MKMSNRKMGLHIVVAISALAINAVTFAESKDEDLAGLVLRQPVSCKLIHAHFSRDKKEGSKGEDDKKKRRINFCGSPQDCT